MNKKILTSILVSPLAFGAWADIPYVSGLQGADGWTQSGISGSDIFGGENGVECPIQGGFISRQVDLLPGTYKFVFTGAKNVELKLGDKTFKLDDGDVTYVYEVTGQEEVNVNLVIQSSNGTGFAFTSFNIVLEFDFEKAAEDLTESLPTINPLEDAANAPADVKESIKAAETELAKIKGLIATLTGNKQRDAYETNKMWNYPTSDAITTAIEALTATVDKVNADIARENEAYAKKVANDNANTENMALVGRLQTLLDDVDSKFEKAIKAVSDDQPNKNLVVAYADSIRNAETAELQGKIKAFEAEVEAAYKAGESVAKAEVFKAKFETISSALGQYRSEVVASGGIACINDAEAYFQIRVLLDKTNSAAMAASLELNKLVGVEGYEDAFKSLKGEWVNTGLPATYTSYLTTLSDFVPVTVGSTITPELSAAISGAAKNLEAANAAYTSATEAINAFVKEKSELVADQNELMAKDIEDIEAIKIPEAPASLPQNLKDEIAVQTTAKANLLDSVEKAYAALELQPKDYVTTLASINTAIETLNGNMAEYDALETKIAAIDKAFAELQAKIDKEVNVDGSVIKDLFEGTETSIEASIAALKKLTPGDEADALVDQINTAIKETGDNVGKLLEADKSAKENLDKYKENLEDLNKDLNGTGFKTFSGVKPATTGLTAGQQTAYETLQAEYDGIKGDPQAIYTALTKLSEKLTTGLEAFEKESATILSNYANTVAAANKKYVDGTYTATETLWAGMDTYFGKESLETQLQKIKNILDGVDTVVTDGDKGVIAAANAIYDELKEVNDDLTGLQSDIKPYQANQTWYNGQTEKLEGLADVLTAATETNNKTSWTPALEYFAGVIGTDTEALTDLESELKEALEKGIANNNISTTDKGEFESRVTDIVKEITGLDQRIKENQGAYTGLLAESESTREAIQNVDNRLKELNEDNKLETNVIEAWQKSIAGFQKELIAINEKLAEAYSKGDANNSKGNISTEYSDLKGDAETLLAKIETDYGKEVATANLPWRAKWTLIYDDLRGDYRNAIDDFNAYGSGKLTNADFSKYLTENVPELGNHEPVYAYSAKITELNTAIAGENGYIAQQNKANHVITESEFEAKADGPAEALADEMEQMVNTMKTNAAAAANTYFNQLVSAAEAEIDAAEDDMADAGIESNIITDALKDANDFIQTQKKYLDDATDKVIAVNTIANEFESFGSTIDLDAAALAQWTRTYGDDCKEVDVAVATVKTYTYINSDNENLAIFNEVVDAVKAMTAPAGIDALKAKLEELDGYMETIRNAAKALETENKALEDADQTTGALNGAVEQLEDDYQALKNLANGLAAGMPVNTIESQIEAIKKAIKDSKNIVADESKINSSIDAAHAAIDAAKLALVNKENQELNGLMSDVRRAYNDASAANESFDEKKDINKYVDELQSKVENLYNSVVADGSLKTDADLDAFKTSAQELEKEISAELLNLQSLTSSESKETSMTLALTEINEVYEEVYKNVSDAKAGLSELISEEYAPQYQALLDELAQISTEVQEAGAAVVLYKDQYTKAIEAVGDELTALNARADAALKSALEKKAIEETTAANAEALNTKLDSVRELLDAAKTQVEEWNVTEWLNYLNSLDSRIAAIEAEITAQSTISKENPDGLTNDEKDDIAEMIDTVPVEIDYYLEMAATQYAETANQAARSAISDARKALADAKVVNSKEITAAINAQAVALENALNECMAAVDDAKDTEGKIAAYEAFAAKAAAIEAEIAKIRETITANTYVLGDIDGTGEPDAADVQTLVGWVGSGMTYAEIADKYGDAIAAAADVNGSGELNISDVTALIDLISTEPGLRPMRMCAPRNVASDASFALQRTGELDGNRVYSLNLYNSDVFIGAQVDINLPVGMTLVDAQLTGRAGNHMLQVFDNGNGNYRLVIFSMDNTAFSGNSGDLVNLTIEGIGNPEAVDMILSTPKHASITGKEIGTTMLESIIEDAKNVKDRIYNAAGQSLRAVQRGINLIRHSDGTITKEMHK